MITYEVAQELIHKIQGADAALDLGGFLETLHPEVRFRLGSSEPVYGREAVAAVVSRLFSMMTTIEHHTRTLLVDSDTVVLAADARFVPKSGESVSLPYVNLLNVDATGLIRDYQIHIDLAPLYASLSGGRT